MKNLSSTLPQMFPWMSPQMAVTPVTVPMDVAVGSNVFTHTDAALPKSFGISANGQLMSQSGQTLEQSGHHALVHHGSAPYRTRIGNTETSFFDGIQSPEQTLDFFAEETGLPKPLGQTGNLAEVSFLLAGGVGGLAIFHGKYRNRARIPGVGPLPHTMKWIMGISALMLSGRSFTGVYGNYLRTNEVSFNPDVFLSMLVYSEAVYLALACYVFAYITMTSYPLIGPVMAGMSKVTKLFGLDLNTIRRPYFMQGSKLLEATDANIPTPANESDAKTSFAFSVDAQHLNLGRLGKNMTSLGQDLSGSVRMISGDYSLFKSLWPLLRNQNHKITATLTQKAKGKTVSFDVESQTASLSDKNNNQKFERVKTVTLVAGSKIRQPNGRTLQLGQDLKVLAGNTYEILDGSVLLEMDVVDAVPLTRQTEIATYNKFKQAKFSITVSGKAPEILARAAKDISGRPIVVASPHLTRILNPLNWFAALFNLTPATLKAQVRKWFHPNPVDVSVSYNRALSDVEKQALTAIAGQNRYTSRLPGRPVVDVSVPLVEFLKSGNALLTLQVGVDDFTRIASIPEIKIQDEKHYKTTLGKNRVDFDISPEWLLQQLQTPGSILQTLATSQKIKIKLPAPYGLSANIWTISPAEKIAFNVKPGSTKSLADYQNRKAVSFNASKRRTTPIPADWIDLNRFGFAKILGQSSWAGVMYGRLAPVLAMTLAGAPPSFAWIAGTKSLRGFDDTSVVIQSGLRMVLSRLANAVAAPAVENLVGTLSFTIFDAYPASLTYLYAWEAINEVKEQGAMQYKKLVLDLLSEDFNDPARKDSIEELASKIQKLEKEIRDKDQHLRKSILKIRLANQLSTGIVGEQDALLLAEIYNGLKNNELKKIFIHALAQDKGFLSSLEKDSALSAFFADEVTTLFADSI